MEGQQTRVTEKQDPKQPLNFGQMPLLKRLLLISQQLARKILTVFLKKTDLKMEMIPLMEIIKIKTKTVG